MEKDGNDLAASFIRGVKWEQLSGNVQERARLCLLDALGATLAGTLTPISQIAAEYASNLWRGDQATILLHENCVQAPGAAFANACAANGLDIDDDAIFTRGHPGAQLIPAALAVSEQRGASGKELLEALVIGYEVAIRAGRCWHAYHEEYQSCGSWGSLACAAAAARILRLDHHQVKHALGIAEYHAPNAPMMRDIQHPSMVKHAIGWGAMNGIISAQLAQRGFTGIPSLLGFGEYRSWIEDLGERYWMAEGVFYKGWASCAWGHAACQAAHQLLVEQEIETVQIEHIKVRTFQEALLLYQELPTTTEQAQFSLKWPLACLLVDGEIGPMQVLQERLSDPTLQALFDKIELELDPLIDQQYKDAQEMDLFMTSAVEIRLDDGRVFDSGIVERGAGHWKRDSLEDKFRWLVGQVLETAIVEDLISMVREFESVEQVSELTRRLKRPANGERRSFLSHGN
jgi:2-methylcitrate dehydratase PrpD